MSDDVKVLLLGGTSHVGKSTLAATLADALGWNLVSTDQLARHPGRPWRVDGSELPDDVRRHYSELTTAGLLEAVTRHYRENVWPIVTAIVHSRVNNPFDSGLVLEGSAILPECVANARLGGAAVIWLTAPVPTIRERIDATSRLATRPPSEQRLIRAFLDRALAFQSLLEEQTHRLGLTCIDATASDALDALTAAARGEPRPG